MRAAPAEHYCVPFVYSKRAAAARSLVSRYGRLDVLWPLRLYQQWNYTVASPPRAPSASQASSGLPRSGPRHTSNSSPQNTDSD